ncbi:DUF4394 domain-containing protein [Frigidibacter sp. MR17.14]|uniref:DUF4394 domain-containing protein n=1 Tax=Frigidibacter sp. MR17.14 TaxID=3126509 RepID=UPI0030129CFF
MTFPVIGSAVALLVSAGAISAATVPAVPMGATGYALGNNGQTLVTMTNLNMPGSASGMTIKSDAGVTMKMSSLAFRPKTRELYGYSDSTDTVYLVNPMTGIATAVVTAAAENRTSVEALGFDFNNVLDAARIVTTADENRVFFPNNSPPTIAGEANMIMPLAYAEGDVNFGADPSIFANAYTNAVANPTTNIQFVLDSELDTLATLANNTGLLTTIGQIWFNGSVLDFTEVGGFDILSIMEGSNQALALLSTGFSTGLYELDLFANGMGYVNASLIGYAGAEFGALDGFAVASPAPVPLPAGVVLLGSALAGAGFFARRRKSLA